MATETHLKNIKDSLEERTETIRQLVEWHLKNDGDKEEDSQRICLLNRINELEAAIAGIETSDLKGEN